MDVEWRRGRLWSKCRRVRVRSVHAFGPGATSAAAHVRCEVQTPSGREEREKSTSIEINLVGPGHRNSCRHTGRRSENFYHCTRQRTVNAQPHGLEQAPAPKWAVTTSSGPPVWVSQ